MSSGKRKGRDSGPAKDLDQVLVKVRDLARALRNDRTETMTPHQLGYTNLLEVSDQRPEEVSLIPQKIRITELSCFTRQRSV